MLFQKLIPSFRDCVSKDTYVFPGVLVSRTWTQCHLSPYLDDTFAAQAR